MSHPNEDLVRTAYDLFAAGDVATLQTLWTDDIVWHIGGATTISGDHEGAVGIIAMFGELLGATEGTFRAELRAVFANDEQGFSLHKATATKGGDDYELWTVLGYTFHEGKVSEIWNFAFDQRLEEKLLG